MKKYPEFELWTLDHQSKILKVSTINISSIENYQGLSFLPVTLLVWRICSLNWDLGIYSFVETLYKYLVLVVQCQNTVLTVVLLQGSWVRLLGVTFNVFSC
jgi:hypothetical protein